MPRRPWTLALLLALAISMAACNNADDAADTESDPPVAEETAEDGPTEAAPTATEAAPTATDAAPTATEDAGGQGRAQAVVDTMLASLDDTWTQTPVAEETEDEGEDPLDACLTKDGASLEDRVDELRVEQAGTEIADTSSPGLIGPHRAKVEADSFADAATAEELYGEFQGLVSDQAVLDCIEATTGEQVMAGLPPGSESTVAITSGTEDLPGDIKLQIVITASVDGQSLNAISDLVFALVDDVVVQAQFTGDGVDPFPRDVAAEIINAAG